MQFTAFVVVTGIAPNRSEAIGRKRDETGLCNPAGDIFDIRIEVPVFVHHHHGRQLALQLGRFHQIGSDLPISFR